MSVSGDTIILTDNGNVSIKILTDSNTSHNVWNGTNFTKATFSKTGSYKQVLQVDTAHGYSVKCTPYHNFITINSSNVPQFTRAKNLNIGDNIQKTNRTEIDIPYVYNSISRILALTTQEDVYTINEPIMHRAIFNNIILSM